MTPRRHRSTTPPATSRRRVGYFRALRLWLTPGMGVKRFVLVAVAGSLLVIVGAIAGVLWLFGNRRQALSEPIEQVLVSPGWQATGGWLAAAVVVIGIIITISALARLNRSLLSNWMPRPQDAALVLHERLSLARGPRIVALGGGTGLSNLLRGLRHHSSNLTAVVTVSDDGGSSGRLREAFGMPAPGDLTDCLAALSDNEVEVGRLLEYRFQRGEELEGHTFGNLLITTLTEVEGDFARAIRVLNALLNLVGSVYPATAEPVSLQVTKEDGTVVRGESQVRDVPGAIRDVSIDPPDAEALPEVVAALREADLVVLGPGSLFTSTIPPLLIDQVRRAVLHTPGQLIYVCNIMTEAGETDGFDAFAHIEALKRHLGRFPDMVVINSTPVDPVRIAAYRREGAEVVRFHPEPFRRCGVEVAHVPLLGDGPHAQHDSERLARWLVSLARHGRPAALGAAIGGPVGGAA